MPFDPSTHDDANGLRTYMGRAKDRDPAGYVKAFRRLCALDGRAASDPIEGEMNGCIAALEQIYFERDGKRTRASRIRKKREKDGARETLAYLARQPDPSEGFRMLVANGLPEFTAEHVIARHQGDFTPETVPAARARLAEFGIAA